MKDVIVPPGGEWIDIGPYLDDAGEKFVGIKFSDPAHDGATISFSKDFFGALVDQLIHVRTVIEDEAIWREAAKLADRDRRKR